jgi:hypothetical protein
MTGLIDRLPLIQGVLSNSPSYSFGRTMSLVTACFCIGWDTAALVFAWKYNMFLLHNHLIPGSALLDLLPGPVALGAQIGFMGYFYTATKYGDLKMAATSTTINATGDQSQSSVSVKQ